MSLGAAKECAQKCKIFALVSITKHCRYHKTILTVLVINNNPMLGMQIKLLQQAECITVQRNCYHILIIIPNNPILAINFKELLQ